MGLKDNLTRYIRDTFRTPWDIEEWDRVPTEKDSLALGPKGVHIDAAILYADLRDSTALVKNQTDKFAAEVYKTYVHSAANAIREEGGTVTAFDGDRVMGVFVGGMKRNKAVDAAFLLSAIVDDILQPELNAFYGVNKYTVAQKVGIDRSQILVTNSGVRGDNDYVWVGTAANNAAKMATLKKGYTTYATHDVYSHMEPHNKTTVSGTTIWKDLGTDDFGYRVYGASAKRVHIPNS